MNNSNCLIVAKLERCLVVLLMQVVWFIFKYHGVQARKNKYIPLVYDRNVKIKSIKYKKSKSSI